LKRVFIFLPFASVASTSFNAFRGHFRMLQALPPTYADLHVRSGTRVGGQVSPSGRLSGWSWAYAPGRGYATNFGETFPLSQYPYQLYPSQTDTLGYPLWYFGNGAYGYNYAGGQQHIPPQGQPQHIPPQGQPQHIPPQPQQQPGQFSPIQTFQAPYVPATMRPGQFQFR